jgi:hypothetical protein
MSGVSSIGEPFLIPRDILSKDEQAVYDMVPEADRKIRYKWWSMHDIMKYYHTGLLTLENDANIFAFRIDLTAPELAQNKFRDNGLSTGLETAMLSLNDVTNAIPQVITSTREKLITQQQETTMNATMRRGGKKGIKKGGAFVITPNVNDPAFTPAEAFSAIKIKNECMNDLEKDIFNSRNRIFVVDGKLPTYTPPALDALKAAEKNLEDEIARTAAMPPPGAPMPGAPMPGLALPGMGTPMQVGGRRRKTRKLRNHRRGKKGKSRRHF